MLVQLACLSVLGIKEVLRFHSLIFQAMIFNISANISILLSLSFKDDDTIFVWLKIILFVMAFFINFRRMKMLSALIRVKVFSMHLTP